MILIGILLTIFMKLTLYKVAQDNPIWYDFAVTIFITILVWEGNLRIDHWLNKNYSWIDNTLKRMAIQFLSLPCCIVVVRFISSCWLIII